MRRYKRSLPSLLNSVLWLLVSAATKPPEVYHSGVLKFLGNAKFQPASSQPTSQPASRPWAAEYDRKLASATKHIQAGEPFSTRTFVLSVDEDGHASAASIPADWLLALKIEEPYPEPGTEAVVARFVPARDHLEEMSVAATDAGTALDPKTLQWKLDTSSEINCSPHERTPLRYAASVNAGGYAESSIEQPSNALTDCVSTAIARVRFPSAFFSRRFTMAFQLRHDAARVDLSLQDGVMGSLDPMLIRSEIHDHAAALKSCYEKRLAARKNLSGVIRTRFVIDAEGKVSAAEITDSTMQDSLVEDCIIATLATLVFPKPVGGGIVIVNYPFSFKPLEPAK